MGIFDFFKGKGKLPELMASGSYDVSIPKERFVCADVRIDGKPHVCVLNEALMEVSPKEPFRWYLSLILDYENSVGDGMPDKEDTVKMQDFIDYLCERLAGDSNQQNAVFLGRVTGNGETQAMWYVNNPGLANAFLQSLIKSGKYPFHFEFVMEEDPDWAEAHYWLDPLK
ncbi:MAG: DUF695 domain-containing protein [Muribaculaceae bacterium]|nr:DUF695 domain-containing protein [Muribaculaceae bacterium]